MTTNKRRDWIKIGFYGTLAAMVVWGVVVESFFFVRQDYQAQIPGLPDGCEGVKIAVTSDWHVGSPHMRKERARKKAQQVAQSQPDLILIPGDFVAHGLMAQTMKIDEIGSVLGALPKAAPTYAVLGNHDHVNHSVEAMVRGLQDASIIPLENASAVVSLRNGACQFQLVGIGDDFWGAAVPAKAFVGVDAEQPVVAMTHTPNLYPGVGKRVDLLIAGHTHGGTACVPGTRWCISGAPKWGSPWIKGIYHTPGTRGAMLVSNGIGNSIIPLRFGALPGYEVVTLHSTRGTSTSLVKSG